MRRFLPLLPFLAFPVLSNAQAPFNTMDSLNINKIHAATLVHGDMWWDPHTIKSECTLYGRYNINFAGAVWMSDYDAGNNLHIAAQTYRQNGNDYWPGPLDAGDTLTYATSQQWAKIWKVNGTDVQYFNSLSTHTISNTPVSILTWPGKGNIYAQGNGGAVLNITDDMAPFVDLNGNGIYEPLQGEYPDFKGEQALWWVFSDRGPTHNQSNGRPLGVEVHAMAYAYSRGTLIDNVIYYDYTIVNKSANNYHNFRFSIWDDMDLGYYLSDFFGFDSVHRMGIGYNGTNDDGGGAGHPVNLYIGKPPVMGITMISLPGDGAGSYVPAGSFDYYNNDFSIIGNPTVDTEYNNYMRAKLKNGQHFTNDFSGPGIPSKCYGSGPDCNYVFTGDPGDTTQWSECACYNNPKDQRFILSSNDFSLNVGASQHIVWALVSTDTGSINGGGGCPDASFSGINTIADTAWYVYNNPLAPLHRQANTGGGTINSYPNPAHDVLYIQDKVNNISGATVQVFNSMGNSVPVPVTMSGYNCELDISRLPTGLYNILYRNGSTQTTTRFLKE